LDRTTRLYCLAAVLLAAHLTGCGPRNHIVVGSKNFTEQLILGEIIAQHLEARLHIPVERKLGLGGTLLAHQALLAGDIDMYPEYTGTAFTNVMKGSGVTDPAVVLEQVRVAYASGFHLDFLDPLGFENSFAMTIRGEDARARRKR
jgi:osmoprotectant transport system substrate-binding protein